MPDDARDDTPQCWLAAINFGRDICTQVGVALVRLQGGGAVYIAAPQICEFASALAPTRLCTERSAP
eukprot:363517-Chlamydomonas_euryale.AAC.7